MKLNPPASSSDIEVAREIARRLHQRRRREDRPLGSAARTPEPARPPVAARAVAPPHWNPPTASAGPPPPPARAAEETAPPSWDAAPGESDVKEPEDALDDLTAQPPAGQQGSPEPEVPAIDLGDPLPEPAAPASDDETDALAAFDEADTYGGTPQVSPFDGADALEPPDIEPAHLESPDVAPPDLAQPDVVSPEIDTGAADDVPEEEELFDDIPGTSWDAVAESCMGIAQARGALLADGTGQLVAARGAWPEPGADAIASRLVAMMDRTLKDTPTRSVSAPVGGLHLTAWRVPAGERLLTAAFIADVPVRAETRPAIDAEIQRSAGA